MQFNSPMFRSGINYSFHFHCKALENYLRTGIFFFLLLLANQTFAQEEDSPKQDKPVRSTFESALLIDNQSVMVPIKGTFEFDILHRFGNLGNGFGDLFGLFAPSNIRLGLTYSPINNLSLGFGFTKSKELLDFSAKYAVFRQTKSNRMPVSVTCYVNMVLDPRGDDELSTNNATDRFSYFYQLIIARKITKSISVQVAPSLSHFNSVPAYINAEGEKEGLMNNDHFAIAISGRAKVSDVTSILVGIDQAITKHKTENPNPNLSLGVEFSTSSHAFQIFFANYNAIVPQYNNVFNSNDYTGPEEENVFDNFLIGFNMTRLWNF